MLIAYVGRRRARGPVSLVRSSLIGFAALALSACGSHTEEVELDLVRIHAGLPARWQSPAIRAHDADPPRLTLEPGVPVEFLARIPARSRLELGLAEHGSLDALRIELRSDSRRLEAAPESQGRQTGSVRLDDFAGDAVALTLENRAGTALTLLAPRLVGVRPARAEASIPELQPQQRMNVLLYVVDTLRADRLGAYGYGRPTTPHLDALARRGVLFEHAYAAGPSTLPSISALFSSRLPSELGGRLDPSGPAATTLAEAFRAAGYRTAAFQANFLLRESFGYARGFDAYQRLEGGGRNGVEHASADVLHDRAIAWLRQPDERPFFVYVQSLDVHNPYAPPAPFREMFVSPESRPLGIDSGRFGELGDSQRAALDQALRDLSPDRYDGAVAYADHEIGRLLAALRELGLERSTLVVVTADHGESLGEGGRMLHGSSLHEELVRVPLIVALPGATRARRVDEIVSLVDLGPTLLELAGVARPPSMQGEGFLPGRAADPFPLAVGERSDFRTHEVRERFVREGSWKLVVSGEKTALFDLSADPAEERNVAASHPVTTAFLARELAARLAAQVAGPPQPQGPGATSEEQRAFEAGLRALGYIEGPAAEVGPPDDAGGGR